MSDHPMAQPWGDEERIATLEATCAAMREALKAYEAWEADMLNSDGAWLGSLPRFTQELYDSWIEVQTQRNKALATDAGKAVLERLKVAENRRVGVEAALNQTETALKVADLTQKGCDFRVRIARAEALEAAAKVAEDLPRARGSFRLEDIAAAIRALKAGV